MNTENVQDAPAPSGTAVENSSANASTSQSPAAPTTITEKIAAHHAAVKEAGAAQAATAGQSDPNTPVVPAYAPNFKYRSAMQEKELDEFWRPLIKDADSEKKVKELFTRADAFDYMKDKLTEKSTSYDSLYTDFESQAKVVDRVMNAKQQGDLDSVFRNIGIADHEVIQWAAKKVDYLQMMQQLPPAQREAIERQQKATMQNQEYNDQLSQMQNQLQSQASQARTFELSMALGRPEVAPQVQFWDNKMGQSGAFYNLVVEEGQKAAHFEKAELSVEQAIARVLSKFGKFIDLQGAGSPQMNPQAQTANVPPNQAAKPVIPVVSGASSKSPIKKQITSIDDIKKRAAELKAQESALNNA